MKKYIILALLFSLGFFGFSYGGGVEDPCIKDPTGDACCNSPNPGPSCNTSQCPDGQYFNDVSFKCETIENECPAGEEWNPHRESCVEECDGYFYGAGFLGAGYNKCCEGQTYDKNTVRNQDINENVSCCEKGKAIKGIPGNYSCVSCSSLKNTIKSYGTGDLTSEQQANKTEYEAICQEDISNCDPKRIYTADGEQKCCDADLQGGICPINNEGSMGIDINQDCLVNGQCSFDIYETLGIRKSIPKETRSSAGVFVQDVILSATFFVGTLITGVLIISGLLYVFAGANGDLANKAKKGITGSLIGLLFVTGSYAFVRLIQFLITGGGG